MGLDQVDCSSFGINFFKFPSKPNSNRNSLLYITKKTRFYPNLSDTTKPNDENWGLKQENILINGNTHGVRTYNRTLRPGIFELGFKSSTGNIFAIVLGD